MAAHSASVTGDTDSRDWRIVAMSFSAGVAFISASVTGRASGATGLTATETQLPSVPSFFAVRDISITPTAELGTASGRGRVCPYVYTVVGRVSIKKKKPIGQ